MFYLELYLTIGSAITVAHLCFVGLAFYTAYDENLEVAKAKIISTAKLLNTEPPEYTNKEYLIMALGSSLWNLIAWPFYLTKLVIDNLNHN